MGYSKDGLNRFERERKVMGFIIALYWGAKKEENHGN